MSGSDDANAAYARRVSSEIEIFARQGPLHRLAGIADWRNERFLCPALSEATGHDSVAAIYASVIAAAIERTGVKTVYSLGCGDGEQEILILRAADRLGFPRFAIHGLELSPISLARARSAAETAGLADRFIVLEHDLNQGLPEGEAPAAVMAHHVLHHIVALEPLFDRVAEQLHPDGVLVTFDMIGRDGHMLWPEVRPLIRLLWAMPPVARRYDHVFQKPMPWYQDWDCAIEGFEGVRAQDILRLLGERFVPETLVVWGGIMQAFINDRAGPNFDPNDAADRAFIEAVHTLEMDLLARRATTPGEMYATFRPRRGFVAKAGVAERLARSIRAPDEHFTPILDAGFPSPYPPVPVAELPVLANGATHPGRVSAPVLREGWETPEQDGVWAVLDEQSIVFRLEQPAAFIDLRLWNPCPTTHRQTLRAATTAGGFGEIGPLDAGESATLRVTASGAPQTEWDIRINCSAYLRPDQDGRADRRPLSYRLISIQPGEAAQPVRRGFRGIADRVTGALRRSR